MAPEIIYLLKVNAGIVLFYAFYKLFCCRDTFFHWRRMALLSFLLLSFLYPLMDIQQWVKEQPAICELADYYALLMMTEADAVPVAAADGVSVPVPDALHLLGYIYWCGVVVLSLRFVIQLLSIFRLVWKSREVQVGHIKVRILPEPINPFSFGRWIFVYLPDLEEDNEQEILTHELTHVGQGHSIDVILSEVVNIICWMNPFSWLLKQEIRLNLEYLADRKVTETVADTRRYQYHLLGLANQKRQTGLYNNFNLSHLKNRIMMMNKKRTCITGRIKYALFALLAAALLLVSNIELVARTAVRLTATEETMQESATKDEVREISQNGVAVFHVTMTDKQGKALSGVKIQTKLNGQLLSFTTGQDGKTDVKIDMTNLRHACMYASAPDGRNCEFVLSPGKTEVTVNIDEVSPAPPTSPNANGVYSIVENMPEFPGGMQAFMEFINKNLQYPKEAQEKGIQGKVIVQFVVEKDGTISDPKISRSVDPLLDAEAIRLVNSMPKWKPGEMKGEAVACKFTVPFTFKTK